MYEMLLHSQTQLGCAVVCRCYFKRKKERKKKKHTLCSPCRYIVVASSSSCAQVSSTSTGFTSWLTVSITIMGVIGSFKSVLKSTMSYLLLPIQPGCFQAVTATAQSLVEMCCSGLFLCHGYCFFGFVPQIPLLYFEWFIHMNEDLCLRAQCDGIIQSNWAAQWLLRLH